MVKEVEKERQGNDSIQINLAQNPNFRGRGGVSCPKPLNFLRLSHIVSDLPVKRTEKGGEKKREKIEINSSLVFKQSFHPTPPGSNVQAQGHKQKKTTERKKGKSL